MDYEKLGAFYLGAEVGAEPLEAPLLYDARDLTTHAVCIGMTGSGKTGLCLDLLEEAAMDRVPAIIIDPKGDMTNLLLTFPELRPDDFEPWIDPDDARRKDMEPSEFAAAQADLWKSGLGKWGQTGERIRTMRATTDLAVFTPGSDAGIPVSVMSSFGAPDADWDEDSEYLRERISGTVSGILGLIGVDADPIQSREHILLSTIFEHAWRAGKDLDLTRLILAIQDPPVRRLGAFDIDTFFPEKDRMTLAMQLNNLIAAPGFQSWIQGQPLDVPSFLTAPDGRPRHSIFYIAHLSEAERMFFVTLLINQVITWMRRQPGTTSLRALVYMDEIFGFLPPVAEPPSKKPFLTLLKQARAYGVGVALTTQNPVDLDYKALTNAGTWFIGRLQTERDKGRLLDGLEVASSGSGGSRSDLDALISGLEKRQFLLHNVHEPEPVTFRTRWAMSYLRGPLTRGQVSDLMQGRGPDAEQGAGVAGEAAPGGSAEPAPTPATPPAAEAVAADDGLAPTPPAIGGDVPQAFFPLELGATGAALRAEERLGPTTRVRSQSVVYRPGVLGSAAVHFLHKPSGAQVRHDVAYVARPDEGPVRWDRANDLGRVPEGTSADVPEEGRYAPLPESINQRRELASAKKDLADYLYRSREITLFEAPDLDEFSRPDESEPEFRGRLTHAARERRDEAIDKLEARYEKKLDTLGDRIRRARSTLSQRERQASARKRETIVAIGESVLGAFLGRRSSRRVSSSLRRVSQSSAATARVSEAEDDLAALEADAAELRAELEAEVAELTAEWDPTAIEVQVVSVTPRRTDVDVDTVSLAWLPYRRLVCDADGETKTLEVPAY
ncbi:MAG: type IV secretion system DNA-binding domain-containing protein [Gemmatimonadetes bacterium]|nr:type IV secretion system DNA-binding domain-containing protein [Gemmatimonadota bacterium]